MTECLQSTKFNCWLIRIHSNQTAANSEGSMDSGLISLNDWRQSFNSVNPAPTAIKQNRECIESELKLAIRPGHSLPYLVSWIDGTKFSSSNLFWLVCQFITWFRFSLNQLILGLPSDHSISDTASWNINDFVSSATFFLSFFSFLFCFAVV